MGPNCGDVVAAVLQDDTGRREKRAQSLLEYPGPMANQEDDDGKTLEV